MCYFYIMQGSELITSSHRSPTVDTPVCIGLILADCRVAVASFID